MAEIKGLFAAKYKDCDIDKIPDYEARPYKLNRISKPIEYSVDCLFEQNRQASGKHCDEFVFCDLPPDATGIYLIERKTHSQDVDKVRQQLQGGAQFIENFLQQDPATDDQPLEFLPVWVSTGLKSSVSKRLRTVRISLRNHQKPIKHVQNKTPLPKIPARGTTR